MPASEGGYWPGKCTRKLCMTPLLHIHHYGHATSEPFLESSASHDLHCPYPRPHLSSL